MKASAVLMITTSCLTTVYFLDRARITLAEFLYALACASIFSFVWWFHWLRHDAAVLDEHIAADPGADVHR
ncbi:hypothetical protein L915_08371 [Phytophthora nicotianae]|uniref:Uncharacterized protein n=3 Tax=Phytophthora nicotianae TaxID=4792 RepID=V9F7X7_PHYNI|nr:hypothetical protein F443_08539 [Phytophthora nicotianae P1569]ETK87142.1 hypothetical protein L915_08371 [Phytophthora nicotianae]